MTSVIILHVPSKNNNNNGILRKWCADISGGVRSKNALGLHAKTKQR